MRLNLNTKLECVISHVYCNFLMPNCENHCKIHACMFDMYLILKIITPVYLNSVLKVGSWIFKEKPLEQSKHVCDGVTQALPNPCLATNFLRKTLNAGHRIVCWLKSRNASVKTHI